MKSRIKKQIYLVKTAAADSVHEFPRSVRKTARHRPTQTELRSLAEPIDDAVLTILRLREILDPSDVPAHCRYVVDFFAMEFGESWVERAIEEYRELPEEPVKKGLKSV